MSRIVSRALIPRKRQERGTRRVESIVASAGTLFASHGFDGTSMNAIARDAGLTIGSLYQYFPSRDAIIDAVAERYLRTWREQKAEFVVRVASATLHEYFREGVIGMFDLFSRYEGVKAFLDADPKRAPSVRAVQEAVAPDALLTHYYPGATPEDLARTTFMVWSLARGAALALATRDHAGERESFIDEIVFACVSYVKARFGEPRPPSAFITLP
jgi:AcrR family transcriptional regulator